MCTDTQSRLFGTVGSVGTFILTAQVILVQFTHEYSHYTELIT